MAQVLTGARGVIKVKGAVVGFVGGVNVTVENTLSDVEVMGQLEVGDLAETAHKCNFTVNYFKAAADSSGKFDAVADNHGSGDNTAVALGFDTSSHAKGVSSMRGQDYFDVEIDDDISGKSVFYMENCKFEGGSGQVDARGVWQGTWNFKARKGYGL